MGRLSSGSVFARYRIEAFLGQGGMGSVYRARDLELERCVALKVISGALAEDPHVRERFRREARAAASIEHPHVVPVFEADACDGRLYLAMRLIDGVDLRTLIRDQGRLEPRRAVALVEQIASALDAAHERGLVHRDVKPANVLVLAASDGEQAFLTDFGIARRAGGETGLTRTGSVVGTLDYLPPEAFRGEPVGPLGDIYALGCMLYEALVGEVPFPGDSDASRMSAHLYQPAPSLHEHVRGLPVALDAVVSRALAKDPRDRFPTAATLAERARAALDGDLTETDIDRPAGHEAQFARASLPEQRVRVPVSATPLIGRQAELEVITQRVRDGDPRLLTLTGPGGTGKTRLALEVAADLVDEFDAGVVFVDLAQITDHQLVLATIAQALDVSEIPDQPLEQTLGAHLRDRRLLLILDNFEQVLAAAPAVGMLLTAASKLRVLATSRAPLRLASEGELPVPPLSLPDLSLGAEADLHQVESVALFLQRAYAIKGTFADREDLVAIAHICVRVDGLPLAIELAAARTRIFSPPALLRRLDQRLKLLTGGARDAPSRHRTLWGAIDWSYGLLAAEQQRLFAHLAIFPGGFTLRAAEAVAGPEDATRVDVIDGVETLVENSLLRHEPDTADGEPRFSMLETIREYGAQQLDDLPECDLVRGLYAVYFAELADYAAENREFDRLELEHANIRAALTWARDLGDGDLELRLAAAMSRFWNDRGYLREGRDWLEHAVGRSDHPSGRALIGLCRLRTSTGGSGEDLLRDLEHAIELCEDVDDRRGLAEAWNLQAQLLNWLGRTSAAESACERAITYAKAAGAAHEADEATAWLLISALYGPKPVLQGIEFCNTVEARAGHDDTVRAFALVVGAALRAMRGEIERARQMLGAGRELLGRLELRVYAANTCQEGFFVETLADNPQAAVEDLRRGYDALADMGETGFLSTVAAYLAEALYRAGRHAEVHGWTESSERAAAPDDYQSQALWRTVRAKVLARGGDHAGAQRLAAEGVELLRDVDDPITKAQALLDLAEVLRLAGRSDEGARAIEEAIQLYDDKGNLVAAAAARQRLRHVATR